MKVNQQRETNGTWNLSINMDEPVLDSYQSTWMNRYSIAINQYG